MLCLGNEFKKIMIKKCRINQKRENKMLKPYQRTWRPRYPPGISRCGVCSWHSCRLVWGCPPKCTPTPLPGTMKPNCRFCTAEPPVRKKNVDESSNCFQCWSSFSKPTFCSKVCTRSTGSTGFFFLDLSIVSRASSRAHLSMGVGNVRPILSSTSWGRVIFDVLFGRCFRFPKSTYHYCMRRWLGTQHR